VAQRVVAKSQASAQCGAHRPSNSVVKRPNPLDPHLTFPRGLTRVVALGRIKISTQCQSRGSTALE